jgi:hypothetical protein
MDAGASPGARFFCLIFARKRGRREAGTAGKVHNAGNSSEALTGFISRVTAVLAGATARRSGAALLLAQRRFGVEMVRLSLSQIP